MKLILISFLIAVPIVSYAISLWLGNFAYRIDFHVQTYVFAAVLSIAIALLSIGSQVVRAARANPVEALKNE